MDNLFDDEISDTSSFRRLTKSYRAADIFSLSAVTAEPVERQAERNLENGDIWPHLDSSPYAIHMIKSYNN